MKKLYIVTERMLKWMEYAIHTKVVENQKAWCEVIDFPHYNISQLKTGKQNFTLQQIEKAAELIQGNTNWLWNLEPNMLRHSKPLSPLELLREATAAFEVQYGSDKKGKVNNIVNSRAKKASKKV